MKSGFIFWFFILFLSSCNERVKNPAQVVVKDTVTATKTIVSVPVNYEILSRDVDSTQGKILRFNWRHKFSHFKVPVFQGKLSDPDFTGNDLAKDSGYVEFITTGCKKNGVNFGGHYTIILHGCGCMCEHVFIVDRKNGKIIDDIFPPGDGKYGYLFNKDSNLLVADSNNFTDSNNVYYNDYFGKPNFFLWRNNKFKPLR